MTRRLLLATAALNALLAAPAAAQSLIEACWVGQVGVMYLIKRATLPTACLDPSHIQITWSGGPAGGTLTGVTAGSGLSGGTITTSGTIAVDFAGPGTATTVARSDHTHGRLGGTGVGGNSLASITTGTQNAAFGNNALASMTSGSGNVALGAGSMDGATSGTLNTAVGSFSLRSTTAQGNTAVGHLALAATTSGGSNTGVGDSALARNTTGLDNTAVGAGALETNLAGTGNTAIGRFALMDATGTGNIALGVGAGSSVNNGHFNIHIGSVGAGSDDHVIRIGSAQTQAYLAGVAGVTSSAGVPVYINSSGKLGTLTSAARVKQEIVDVGAASRRLLDLRPVQFRYKPEFDDGAQLVQYGLIAEEVAAVFPELAHYGADGRIETVRYHMLPALLLNELQRQQEELQSLRRELADLRSLIARR